MFERSREPLLSRKAFYRRVARSVGISILLVAVTLAAGSIVFHWLEGFSWLDAVLNCVLIMTGVGTAGAINTSAGKIFTGFYSIGSTFVFFAVIAIIITPLFHRFLHKFHLDLDRKE